MKVNTGLHLRTGILLASLAGALAAAPLFAQINAGTKPDGISELAQKIERVLEKTRTSGASVALVSRDRVLWTAGFGKADLSGAEVCQNKYCWKGFGRRINSVEGFGGESARLVYITSPPSRVFLGVPAAARQFISPINRGRP